jgi:hypothetical protein
MNSELELAAMRGGTAWTNLQVEEKRHPSPAGLSHLSLFLALDSRVKTQHYLIGYVEEQPLNLG